VHCNNAKQEGARLESEATRLSAEVIRLQTELTAALNRAQTNEAGAATAVTEADEVSVPLQCAYARMHEHSACTIYTL
jgi:hypothetical protein